MLEVIGIISALGGPIVGAAIITEAVLARVERHDAASGPGALKS
ncbi:MAG TPA: hypothetical protein VGK33_23240 [Chloroflexota bacterium]|jgi:hypothetical protein